MRLLLWLREAFGRVLCFIGIHPWAEESRWRGPITVLTFTALFKEDALCCIDHCPRCGRRWKSVIDEGYKGIAFFPEHQMRMWTEPYDLPQEKLRK